MQAIIMAAGRGNRLGELTEDIPKAFLEVHGIKLIEYNIAMLHTFGIKDITVVTGYRCDMFNELAEKVEGLRCIFNPFFEFANVLGSFYMGQHVLEEDFVYLHGDTLCAPEIFEKMLRADGDIVLPVEFGACDEEAMKVRTAFGHVIEINKTMPCQSSEGEFIGIAKVNKEVLPDLQKTTMELMKEKAFSSYFEAAIQRLIAMERYYICTISTEKWFWGEVDFLEDFQKVDRDIPDGLIQIGKGEFRNE